MSGNIITVKKFNDPQEAELFKIELESIGVKAYLANEGVIAMNPLYTNAIGGIEVNVHVKDIDKVKEFFNVK